VSGAKFRKVANILDEGPHPPSHQPKKVSGTFSGVLNEEPGGDIVD